MNDNSDNRLLNLGEISEAIKLPAGWIRDEARAGRIPCLRVGRRLVFNEQAVRAAVAKHSAAASIAGTRGMAKDSAASRKPALRGLARCSNENRSVEAGGAHDRERVADQAESPAGQRDSGQEASSGLGNVRSARSAPAEVQGRQGEKKRVVSLGESKGEPRESLLPEERPALVQSVRPTGAVTAESVCWLIEFQNYRCALTGRSLTPDTTALDHIVPIKRGGEHVIENAQALHKDVNRAKNSLTEAEFLSLCREVVQWCDVASPGEVSETNDSSTTSQSNDSQLSGETA